MDPQLKALIESAEFKCYHEESQAPKFNPFDVLQVAGTEIRHSNVLAWLLQPGGTHGIGGRFLRKVVEHLTDQAPDASHDAPSLRRLTGFDDKDNVEVTREDYHDGWYADITVGFKTEKVLLIIENKLVGWHPESEKQTAAYQKALRERDKDKYEHFPGALLTASSAPKAGGAKSDVMHVIWKDVGEIIRSLRDDPKNFTDVHVRFFVERYLDVIEKNLVYAGDDLAERLREQHPGILEKLQKEKSQGKRALLDEVDEPHRTTIERWMEHFEKRPRKLREQVAEYLTRSKRVGAGIKRTAGRGSGKDWAWLHWGEPSVKDQSIGNCICWWFSFGPRSVTLELATPDPKNPKTQEVWRFLQDTPIEPDSPDRWKRYPMEEQVIYRHSLLKDDDLSGPFDEVVTRLRRRMDEFFGRDGDYGRIERYFRCLAFDPRGPQPDVGAGEAESPTPTAS